MTNNVAATIPITAAVAMRKKAWNEASPDVVEQIATAANADANPPIRRGAVRNLLGSLDVGTRKPKPVPESIRTNPVETRSTIALPGLKSDKRTGEPKNSRNAHFSTAHVITKI